MYTLNDYKNNVITFGSISGRSSLVPTFLFDVQYEVVGLRPYWWNVTYDTLTTVSGQVEYALSYRVDGQKVSKMSDETDDSHIDLVDLAAHLWSDPTPTESGSPYDFAFIGQHSVQDVPDANSKITVVSDDGDDAGTVVVSGEVSGVYKEEEITLDGTTGVPSGYTYDASQKVEISKGVTQGTITATADSGTTTIATIPPSYTMLEVPWIRLRYVPNSANTLKYWFYKVPLKISKNNQHPDFPAYGHGRVLLPGVLEYAHRSVKDFKQANEYERIKEDGIYKLNVWTDSQPGRRIIKGGNVRKNRRGRINPTTTITMPY